MPWVIHQAAVPVLEIPDLPDSGFDFDYDLLQPLGLVVLASGPPFPSAASSAHPRPASLSFLLRECPLANASAIDASSPIARDHAVGDIRVQDIHVQDTAAYVQVHVAAAQDIQVRMAAHIRVAAARIHVHVHAAARDILDHAAARDIHVHAAAQDIHVHAADALDIPAPAAAHSHADNPPSTYQAAPHTNDPHHPHPEPDWDYQHRKCRSAPVLAHSRSHSHSHSRSHPLHAHTPRLCPYPPPASPAPPHHPLHNPSSPPQSLSSSPPTPAPPRLEGAAPPLLSIPDSARAPFPPFLVRASTRPDSASGIVPV